MRPLCQAPSDELKAADPFVAVMAEDQLSLRCGCTPVADRQYDEARHPSPIEAVIDAVAAASGAAPRALPPLYESVDPDALDQLFRRTGAAAGTAETILSFTANGWNVFVRDDGRIRVCDPSGPERLTPVFD